ncbi:DUF2125 domain-containing protein [Paracoccus sp. TK19116]|uniref:DUF2125 domain-containing protein n=1 Tax=Paracoccus albicereus TaxID=2922394 RepID=A0ABT1MNW2_9RHOB|nr:DUF2125 domain-containing protein [Paracoccus albicereus]MCQ0969866.1 DUF2125 domain-containing protein [Paracoccus albicereus]
MLIILAILVVAAWLGGETWLARQIARGVEDDPSVAAAEVTPLREPSRFGVRVEKPLIEGQGGELTLGSIDLWAAPWRPQKIWARPSTEAEITLPERVVEVELPDAKGYVHYAPLSGFALHDASISLTSLSLDGQPALGPASIRAELSSRGAGAPRGAMAAYDITMEIANAQPAALTMLGLAVPPILTQAVSAEGKARLYLTDAPARGFWLGDEATRQPVAPVAVQSQGLTLRFGELQAILRGDLRSGPTGLTDGTLLIDTSDAEGFLGTAADAGLIPPMAVGLAGGVLNGLASAAEADEGDPPVPDGAIRLRIDFADGETRLAGQVLGPAPAFPGAVAVLPR